MDKQYEKQLIILLIKSTHKNDLQRFVWHTKKHVTTSKSFENKIEKVHPLPFKIKCYILNLISNWRIIIMNSHKESIQKPLRVIWHTFTISFTSQGVNVINMKLNYCDGSSLLFFHIMIMEVQKNPKLTEWKKYRYRQVPCNCHKIPPVKEKIKQKLLLRKIEHLKNLMKTRKKCKYNP